MISGDRIKQAREIRAITQAELAAAVGVDQSHVSLLEQDAREPSVLVLEKIALVTGFPISFFSRESGPEFPLGSLLYRRRKSLTTTQRDQVRQVARLMFEIWQSMVQEFKSIDVRLPRISGEDPVRAARITRAALGLSPDTPVKHLITTLEKNGVSVISLNFDIDEHDAFSLWVDTEPRTPLIVVTSGKSGDRSRFNVAHEIGHLVLHQTIRQTPSRMEEEAHIFASEFLLPEETIRKELLPPLTVTGLAELKGRWGVSMQALMYKAHRMEIITDGQRNYLYRQLGVRGWIHDEPVLFPAERPRLIEKMTERIYGMPLDYNKLAEDSKIPVQLLKQHLPLSRSITFPPDTQRAAQGQLMQFKTPPKRHLA